MAEQGDMHHVWTPITDVDDHDANASSTEVPTLLSLWEEMRDDLTDRQIREFNDRLNREWAIETGIIERLYTIDQGTTQLLIEHGINDSLISHSGNGKSPELIAGIVRDHQEAVEWLFDVVAQSVPLSTSFIRELHAFMTRKQRDVEAIDQFGKSVSIRLNHGEYKKRHNNPTRTDGTVHEYCPPEQVDQQMEELVRLHADHKVLGIPPDVSAAWLHHRFTQIHPFQDGNGRVARALASLELIRGQWFPLVVTRTDRSNYMDSLEEADSGNLHPLIRLIGAIEKQWFLKALSITKDVQREEERLDQMLEAIHDDFRVRNLEIRKDQAITKKNANKIQTKAKKKFNEICKELRKGPAFAGGERKAYADTGEDSDANRRTWYRSQIIQIANEFDYYANMRDYHSWVRLVLITETGRSEVLLSFHAVGREYRGIIGASMCFFRIPQGEGDDKQMSELQPVSQHLFQLNYKENQAEVLRRFEPWLESALLMGLGQWRRGE